MTRARELAELAAAYDSGGLSNMKNRIINGNMVIDQRNAGASVTANATIYALDRFKFDGNASGVYTVQRSTTVPSSETFTNSAILTVTTANASVASNLVYGFRQAIEGFNVADFGFGTANATAITLSFWVRSSVTGTYSAAFFNSAFDRSYVATYTISAANTWEKKTITISGDTTGTWLTNSSSGLEVYWDLGSGVNYDGTAGSWAATGKVRTSGSVRWISTNGATFYITGVQLEKGSTATSFDYRPYGLEELLCKRYFQRYLGSLAMHGVGSGTTVVERLGAVLPVEMRATPTVAIPTAIGFYDGSGVGTIAAVATNYSNPRSVEFSSNFATGSSATSRIVIGYVGVGDLTLNSEL